MLPYIQEILDPYKEAEPMATGIKSSAVPEDLFKIDGD